MKTFDRIALTAALYLGLHFLAKRQIENDYMAAAFALVASVASVVVFRRLASGRFIVERRSQKEIAAKAVRFTKSLATADPEIARETIFGAICDEYNLETVLHDENGSILLSDTRRIWLEICLRHPDSGVITSDEAAKALLHAKEHGCDQCALVSPCMKEKCFADPALADVLVIDGRALAHLFTLHPEYICKAAPEPRPRIKMLSLLKSVLRPPSRRQSMSHFGYALLLSPVWLFSGGALLLACILFHLSYALYGLLHSSGKRHILPELG